MKIKLVTNANEGLRNELSDIVRAFNPYMDLDPESEEYISVFFADSLGRIQLSSSFEKEVTIDFPVDHLSESQVKKEYKRYSKSGLYRYISNHLNVKLPYGSLTGIRPTKMYYDLQLEEKNPLSTLCNFFDVSEEKANLIERVVRTQCDVYGKETNRFDSFINIPFCPTRCSYCSFICDVVDRVKGKLEKYVESLILDIKEEKKIMKGLPRSIYVGGGTPTSIPLKLLEEILTAIDAKGQEFTVEAGRADTLNSDVLALMKEKKVTRISVNPQTFKDSTLQLIGRKGDSASVLSAYALSRNYGFDINMDLISGLPQESFEDFKRSIDMAIDLSPENITVHSLSLKRGSILTQSGYTNDDLECVLKQNQYAVSSLLKAGYSPYYMYRQKNTVGRLENVGYAKAGKVCVYNVDNMEETHTIYASGAGAISKRVDGNLITRLAEAKDISLYSSRIEEYIQRKKEFFS